MNEHDSLAKMSDPGSERSLIASIFRHGKDAYLNSHGVLKDTDFYLSINQRIWSCIESLFESDSVSTVDKDSILMKAKSLGIEDTFESKQSIEYLELVQNGSFSQENTELFIYHIRKYSVLRDLRNRYKDTLHYLDALDNSESLSDVIDRCEADIVDTVSSIGHEQSLGKLSDGIDKLISDIIAQGPVDQVGIPTGFPRWDAAIGGGARRSCVQVIGARSKVGKSWLAANMSVNIGKIGVPVLYLDTELTQEYQQARFMCIESGCPIRSFESGQFVQNDELTKTIFKTAEEMKEWPVDYESIAGCSPTEALAIVRKWIVKNVGFREDGQANDCVVIYDYFKLTSGSNLSSFNPEHIELGLMLTNIHNFAVKYGVAFIGFVQLNRQALDDQENSGVIAGSDRILWLCSSFTILKDKAQSDVELNCGFEHGNKKLIPIDCRMGPGLSSELDYINLEAELSPRKDARFANGKIIERETMAEVYKQNRIKEDDIPEDD